MPEFIYFVFCSQTNIDIGNRSSIPPAPATAAAPSSGISDAVVIGDSIAPTTTIPPAATGISNDAPTAPPCAPPM
jgi:hypothetical protein